MGITIMSWVVARTGCHLSSMQENAVKQVLRHANQLATDSRGLTTDVAGLRFGRQALHCHAPMTLNMIIGLCLIAFAAVSLTALVLWSRTIINRIDRTGPRSARMILRDLAAPEIIDSARDEPGKSPESETDRGE